MPPSRLGQLTPEPRRVTQRAKVQRPQRVARAEKWSLVIRGTGVSQSLPSTQGVLGRVGTGWAVRPEEGAPARPRRPQLMAVLGGTGPPELVTGNCTPPWTWGVTK